MLQVESFICNEWQENCYLIYDDTKSGVLVDCGAHSAREFEEIARFVETKGLTICHSLCTHLHLDHIFGLGMVKDRWGVAPEAGLADMVFVYLWDEVTAILGLPGEPMPPTPSPFLKEGNIVRFGDSELSVIETPGHSPGSLCFYNAEYGILFSGDLLFCGSVGRTDLIGGDYVALHNSIKNKIYTLPADVRVLPGHGPATTVGFERESNMYVRG